MIEAVVVSIDKCGPRAQRGTPGVLLMTRSLKITCCRMLMPRLSRRAADVPLTL